MEACIYGDPNFQHVKINVKTKKGNKKNKRKWIKKTNIYIYNVTFEKKTSIKTSTIKNCHLKFFKIATKARE